MQLILVATKIAILQKKIGVSQGLIPSGASLLPPSRPTCHKFLKLVPFHEFGGGLWYPLEPGGGHIPLIAVTN
jgi:hypothetical protein